jgi:hypothetical protein
MENERFYAETYLPYYLINKTKNGMIVQIELEGYSAHEHGYIKGDLRSVIDEIKTINGQNYFTIIIDIDSHSNKLSLKENMKGVAFILITNESLLQYFFNKIF